MSDNNSNFQQPPRKMIALDNRKLSLMAVNNGMRSFLSWVLKDNNPAISVWTGDPSEKGVKEKGYGKIVGAVDTPTINAIFTMIRRYCKADAPVDPVSVHCKGFIYPGGKKSENAVTKAEIVIGKDAKGVVYISVLDKYNERPRIRFNFGPSEFHLLTKVDGTPWTAGEMSVIYAEAYADSLQQLFNHLQVTEFKEPEPRPQQGGNNGGQRGGYNNGGGNNGGYQQRNNNGGGGGGQPPRQAPADDDIDAMPF